MSNLGLVSGSVKVVPYNPKWHDLFIEEKNSLLEYLDGYTIDIQHVGTMSRKRRG